MNKDNIDRLNEIYFIRMITCMIKTTSNPVYVLQLMEDLCKLTNSNFAKIRLVINSIMTQDRRILPTKNELLLLYQNTKMPVRKVCKELGISQRDYYRCLYDEAVIEANTQPRFTEDITLEINKLLDKIEQLFPERSIK